MPITRRSLNFDFVRDGSTGGQGFLDSLFTFARASTATRFNASGVLETVASGVPRFDFDPATLLCRGLLIEEARTNLLTRSAEFDVDRILISTVVTANTHSAPDGTMSADSLAFTGGGQAAQFVSGVATNTTYIFSVWLKVAAGAGAARLKWYNGQASTDLYTADLAVTTAWQRFSCAFTTGSSVSSFNVAIANATDGANRTIIAWGAQLEAGAFPTSYIPTTSAAVTRAEDALSITSLSPWFSAAAGTLLAEANPCMGGVVIDSSPSRTRIYSRIGDGMAAARVYDGTSWGGEIAFGVWGGGAAKLAMSYQPGRIAAAYNGSAVMQDTTLGLPLSSGVQRITLGAIDANFGGGMHINGHLRRFVYLPFSVDDITLKQMTVS